jgi:hypothetical protein
MTRSIVRALCTATLIIPVGMNAQETKQPAGGKTNAASTTTKAAAADSGPTTISYKGVRITPVLFFTSDLVWRQRNQTADIASSFNAIPYTNSTNGQMTEFRMSARASRVALGFEGNLEHTKLAAYWESDFLSAGTSSNSVQSNSYTLRLRQFFGQAMFDWGGTITAGETWSLATTNKKGTLPRAEYIPGTIDGQYFVGYDWARQPSIRFSMKATEALSYALAVEGPQTTFAARGAPSSFVIGGPGGAALNSLANYSTDYAPDVVGKISFDGGFGHFELKAVGRAFRNRLVDLADENGGTRNDKVYGGGLGFGSFMPMFGKKVDIGISGLWGLGIGRYGASGLPDVTINPDGTLAPIRAAHGMFTMELHATPKLDIYGYAGAEYAYRHAGVNGVGGGVGYGTPLASNAGCDAEYAPGGPFSPGAPGGTNAACNADTRSLYQGNAGFWYRFYKGTAGTFQWGMQYSYTSKNTWAANLGGQPKAVENMVFSSIRYILP